MLWVIRQWIGGYRLVAIATLFLLTGLVVAGCASQAGNQPQVQHCGMVQTLNGHISESASSVSQAENCFWQAFQQCRAATLTFEASGIDAGEIHSLTLSNTNGTCSISDATQHYTAPGPAQPGKTYTCTGLTQQKDGLHFSVCGDEGVVIVPLPQTAQPSQTAQPPQTAQPQACGRVNTVVTRVLNEASARQVENCFWQAYQQCRAATLVYTVSGIDTVLTRTFVLRPGTGTCSISETSQQLVVPANPSPARTYTCSALTQKDNGLHFSACGGEGNILVPA